MTCLYIAVDFRRDRQDREVTLEVWEILDPREKRETLDHAGDGENLDLMLVSCDIK